MDRDRPSRRAHILSSINPLHEPSQPAVSHAQDPSPSPPPTRERQPRTIAISDDDDDDDGYGPAEPGKKGHNEGEHEREHSQPSDGGAYASNRPGKFRFKSEKRSRHRRYSIDPLLEVKSRNRRSRARDEDGGANADSRDSRREREGRESSPHPTRTRDGESADREDDGHHHHRRRRRHRSHRHEDSTAEDRSSKRRRREHRDKKKQPGTGEQEAEDPFAPPPMDAEAAFRESLFDAMADDEGAAYWEGVYGQPIHTYGPPPGAGADGGGARGPLEQMTDHEYAEYVMHSMWEKTHPGQREARERRERERARKAAEAEHARHDSREARRLEREVEASLRRGRDRRRALAWADRWRRYVEAWDKGGVGSSSSSGGGGDGNGSAAWPVESGRRADIAEAAVKEFFARCADAAAEEEEEAEAEDRGGKRTTGPASRLKDERIRWHPDKVQQRLGGNADEALLRDVTAVFQIVDKLWAEARASKA